MPCPLRAPRPSRDRRSAGERRARAPSRPTSGGTGECAEEGRWVRGQSVFRSTATLYTSVVTLLRCALQAKMLDRSRISRGRIGSRAASREGGRGCARALRASDRRALVRPGLSAVPRGRAAVPSRPTRSCAASARGALPRSGARASARAQRAPPGAPRPGARAPPPPRAGSGRDVAARPALMSQRAPPRCRSAPRPDARSERARDAAGKFATRMH